MKSSRRLRAVLLALVVLAATGAAVTYVVVAARGADTAEDRTGSGPRTGSLPDRAMLIVDHDAVLSWVSLDEPAGKRTPTGLQCARAYMAAGAGLCLAPNETGTTYSAVVFDDEFEVQGTVPVLGTPSRTRVSEDGRWGAVTTFVLGDSYAEGSFSTRTTIVDMRSGKAELELERLRTTDADGAVIDAPDVNYWGVTFAEGDTFYATLAYGGETYLIRGDVGSRRAETLRKGVECPSLSPDGTRIAYKKRIEDGIWQPRVLDLETMDVTELPRTERLDDQIEWIDDETLVFGVQTGDLFTVRADGSGEVRPYLTNAMSPATIA